MAVPSHKNGRCLAHLSPDELATVLERLGRDGKVDARGAEICIELLRRVLDALPRSSDGGPRFQQADFRKATFKGNAGFDGATFMGSAGFRGATFTGDAGFEGATFGWDARFDGANFGGRARFAGSTFAGDAGFDDATFQAAREFGPTLVLGALRLNGVSFIETVDLP